MSIRIGLQLFTVRDYMKRNLQETLVKVAGCGYQGVEFSSFYTYTSKEVKSIINALGISAAGAHIEYEDLITDTKKQFEYIKDIGIDQITIPFLSNEEILDDEVIDNLNKICDTAEEYEIKVCYHNHDKEFEKVEGEYVLDHLIRSVPKLNIEFDTFWADSAGIDIIPYMKHINNRLALLHLKDKNSMQLTENPNIGEGNMDISGILQTGEELQVPWAFVEMDRTGGDQMVCSSISRINLLKMGY